MAVSDRGTSSVSTRQESSAGDSIGGRPTPQMTDSKHDKVYKDVTREEELEIILQEIENMVSFISEHRR